MSTRIKTSGLIIIASLLLASCAAQPEQPAALTPEITGKQTESSSVSGDVVEESPIVEEAEAEAVEEAPAAPTETKEVQEEPAPELSTSTDSSIIEPVEQQEEEAEPVIDSAPPVVNELTLAQLAYNDVRRLVDGSYTATEDVVMAGDNLPEYHSNLVQDMMSIAFSMFDEDYGVVSPYSVIAFTHDDLAWADQVRSSYPIGLPGSSWQSWASQTNSDNDQCWLGSASRNYNYICMPTDPKDANALKSTIAHEYFHSIQQKIAPSHTSLPVWVIEGSATYIGNVAAGYGASYTQDHARFWQTYHLTVTYGGTGFGDYVHNMTASEFANIYKSLEVFPTADSVGVQQKYAVYQSGSLATEYLIAEYSYDTFMKFKEEAGAGTYWKTAFSNNFGMSVDEFYGILYDHLRTVY